MSNNVKGFVAKIDGEWPSDKLPGAAHPTVLTSLNIGEGDILAGSYRIPVTKSIWPEMCVEAAKSVGCDVPENFVVIQAQVFYKDLKVEEARLSGYIRRQGDSSPPTPWQTDYPPTFSQNAQGAPILSPDDEGRTHFSLNVTKQLMSEDERFFVNITLDVTENHRLFFSRSEPQLLPLALTNDSFDIQTSQEVDILLQSAGYGGSRKNWRNEIQRDSRIFEMKGATHYIEIPRRRDEMSEPVEWAVVERLTDSQNSDFALALFYVVSLLAPPPSVSEDRAIIGGWIDLNDVMEKIGWMAEKPSPEKREMLRRQIWDFLRYGEQAIVCGRRSTTYKDRASNKVISTDIESPAWRITDVQRPQQDSLFSENKPAPVQARVVISEQWEPLFRSPFLAQYFPLGELIGAIPPKKIAGDWARMMGLNLLRNWRINSHETLSGKLRLSRRELLTHYLPKTKSVEEILNGEKPKRAVEYYRAALNILAESGLIAASGDAAKEMTAAKMLSDYSGYRWGEKWLDGLCNLAPGPKALLTIEAIAANKFQPKPRDLQSAKKRRGRPKKIQ
jgi:hypothetical protein